MHYFLVFALLLGCQVLTAAEGLDRLMEGNKRYVNDALEHPNRTSERREAVTATHEPFATIVGCADSRVSPEIIFDQGVGDLFVVRVAGNVVGPLEMESIDFATHVLHSSVILVLGHENCGAVNAVITGNTADIKAIAKLIEPAIKEEKLQKAANPLEAAIKANAKNVKAQLLNDRDIKKLVDDKKLTVAAAYYNLQTGEVTLLD